METLPAAKPDHFTPRNPKKMQKGLDLTITEVMWGLDESAIGEDAETARQWIEIYNKLDVAFPLAGVSLVAKSGRTAPIPAPAAIQRRSWIV